MVEGRADERSYTAEKIARYVNSPVDEVKNILDLFEDIKNPDGTYSFEGLRLIVKLASIGKRTQRVRVRFKGENKLYAVDHDPEQIEMDSKTRYLVETTMEDGSVRRGILLEVKQPLPDIFPDSFIYECQEIKLTDTLPETTVIYTRVERDDYSELWAHLTDDEVVERVHKLMEKSNTPLTPDDSMTRMFMRKPTGDVNQDDVDGLMDNNPDTRDLEISQEEIDELFKHDR